MDLRSAMKAAGLSNEELARLTGMPSSRIAAYRSGGRRMGHKTAARIAEFVNTDSAELVSENRLAAMKRAADQGDVRNVLNAVKSIASTVEECGGGKTDEALDELVNHVVTFAENHEGASE